MNPIRSRRSFLGLAATGAAALLAGSLLVPTASASPTATPSLETSPTTSAAPTTPAAEPTVTNVTGSLNKPGTLVADLGVELHGLPTDQEFEIRVFEHGSMAYAKQVFPGAPKTWMTTSFRPPAGGWKPGALYGVWAEATDGSWLWKANFTPSKAAVQAGHAPKANNRKTDNRGGLAKTGV